MAFEALEDDAGEGSSQRRGMQKACSVVITDADEGSHCAPMVSRAFGGCMESGSTQHSRRAHGEILMTSGGSTPMLRHSTSATAVVLSRSFCRHFETIPSSSNPSKLPPPWASWRACIFRERLGKQTFVLKISRECWSTPFG